MRRRPQQRPTRGWWRMPRPETLQEMLERCRRADEERIANGTQDAFLTAQAHGPVLDWREQLLKARKDT